MQEEKRQQKQQVNDPTNIAAITDLLIDSDTSPEFQQAPDWEKAMNRNFKEMNNNFKIVVEHLLRTENIATEAIAIAHEAKQKAETSDSIATEAKGEAADAKQIDKQARDSSADDCDTTILLL